MLISLRDLHSEYGDFSIRINNMDEYWDFANMFYEEAIWRSYADLREPFPATLSMMNTRVTNKLYLNVGSGYPKLLVRNSEEPEFQIITIDSMRKIPIDSWEELMR